MLTHVDENNLPTMVDVSDKLSTERTALAQSQIQLPPELQSFFHGGELVLKKGPVFQTAIIAGTMAAKKTSDLIPFCHPIPLESCKLKISADANLLVTIRCTVKTTGKTGVEMEALQGAMTAALTIYDMCKAVSHNMTIQNTKLLQKTGGKRTVLERPLYGLVLTGGRSERMGEPKALLNYKGVPHAQHLLETLQPYCQEVFLSARKNQWQGTPLEHLPILPDLVQDKGPIAGLMAAFTAKPEANWLVVACDLPYVDSATIEGLLRGFDPESVATCYRHKDKGFPEALCALYTPGAGELFAKALEADLRCPVKILRNANCHLLDPVGKVNLANVNTQEEFREVKSEIN